MLKEPSTFRQGLAFVVAWAVWLGAGLAYAMSHGSITSFLVNMPDNLKVIFFIWVAVLSALFGQAIFRIFLGITGRAPPRL